MSAAELGSVYGGVEATMSWRRTDVVYLQWEAQGTYPSGCTIARVNVDDERDRLGLPVVEAVQLHKASITLRSGYRAELKVMLAMRFVPAAVRNHVQCAVDALVREGCFGPATVVEFGPWSTFIKAEFGEPNTRMSCEGAMRTFVRMIEVIGAGSESVPPTSRFPSELQAPVVTRETYFDDMATGERKPYGQYLATKFYPKGA